MKNLLACLAVFAAFSVSAQQFSPPWNPDADDNGSIGATDVLATLSVYGNEWGVDTSLTCDYVPTDFEQWFIDVLTGSVIIDSLLFQQIQLTTTEVFVLGCPDPVTDTLVFEQTMSLLPNFFIPGAEAYYESAPSGGGGYAWAYFQFGGGNYELVVGAEPDNFTSFTSAGFEYDVSWNWNQSLPFGSSLTLGESGFEGQLWSSPYDYVQFIQLIPYWHYAE